MPRFMDEETTRDLLAAPYVWETLPDQENSVGAATGGYAKEILRDRGIRKMHGRITRATDQTYSASSGAGYLIHPLDAGDLPVSDTSFIVRCGGGGSGVLARGRVVVTRSPAEVRLYIDDLDCTWVDLGTIEWTAAT